MEGENRVGRIGGEMKITTGWLETEKEVKDFLIQSQILSGIRLFELKPIKVKYDVEI